MGTNYYMIQKRPSLYNYPIHIGKSSAGWKFLFQGYESIDIYNNGINICDNDNNISIKFKEDWEKVLDTDDFVILDEYDNIVKYEDFWEMVETKQVIKNEDNFKNAININGYRFTFNDFS